MKSDNKTVRERVEEVLQLRLMGALPTDIRRHADDEKWNVSVRQLQRYIAEADKLLLENVEKNRDALMAYHYCARRALYARAMAVSDYSTARQLLNDEAKLLGLFPATGVELTGKGGAPLYPTLEEMVAAIAKAEQGGGGPDETDGADSTAGDSAAVAGSEALPG